MMLIYEKVMPSAQQNTQKTAGVQSAHLPLFDRVTNFI